MPSCFPCIHGHLSGHLCHVRAPPLQVMSVIPKLFNVVWCQIRFTQFCCIFVNVCLPLWSPAARLGGWKPICWFLIFASQSWDKIMRRRMILRPALCSRSSTFPGAKERSIHIPGDGAGSACSGREELCVRFFHNVTSSFNNIKMWNHIPSV